MINAIYLHNNDITVTVDSDRLMILIPHNRLDELEKETGKTHVEVRIGFDKCFVTDQLMELLTNDDEEGLDEV
jgi:hypothetical protein